MKLRNLFLLVCFISVISALKLTGQPAPDRQWPSFRGYLSGGVLDDANLPDTFDPVKLDNIRWKTLLLQRMMRRRGESSGRQ